MKSSINLRFIAFTMLSIYVLSLNQAGTAMEAQKQMLQDGHYQAK